MKWWLRIANMFSKKPVYERATVRLDKIEKWLELQFKSILSPAQNQLLTNFELLQSTVAHLEAASLRLSQAIMSQEKIHVYTLALEHRKQFINLVHAITSSSKTVGQDFVSLKEHYDSLDRCIRQFNDFLPRIQKTLDILAAEETREIIGLIHKVEVNYRQALDIFDDVDNNAYLSIQKSVQSLLAKRERKEELLLAIDKKKQDLSQLKTEARKYQLKVQEISHDDRYRHERTAMRSSETKYRVSYYALDLQENQSRLERLEHKITILNEDVSALNDTITGLNIEAERQLVISKIKKKLGIEVEIVS